MKQTPSGTVRILCLAGTADETRLPRRAHHRPRVCKRSIFASSLYLCRPRARKRNNEFCKYAWLGIDVDLAAMLFHHDVVAHRQAEAGPLAGGFGGEKGIKHLLLYFQRDPGAVVAYPDLHPVTEAFCGRAQRRLKTLLACFLALGGGGKTVRNHVEEHPRNFLRVEVDQAGVRIEVALQRDIEPGFLRARAVIGQIEAFL